MKIVKTFCIAAAIATAALLPVLALAVDGVILIDQNKVLAGNVVPGDAAGFPLTITQPGSYRLAGNLTSPQDVSTIIIASSNVELDLNGFTITCSVQGSTHPTRLACIQSQGAIQNIAVHGGILKGIQIGFSQSPSFCAGGLDLVSASRIQVHDIIADSPGCGLEIGAQALVRHT